MNKLPMLICLLCLKFSIPGTAQPVKVIISISNPVSFNRNNELVPIAWGDIILKYPGIDTANFKIINIETKKELPWQLEFKGEKNIQNLLIQLNIAGNTKARIGIQKGKSQTVNSKTYGRYVPERKDDFAWENDKIAFRLYGKALELTPSEMAYGMDVWVKRTNKLIINERYKRGEYHIDHGDGMDYYHVGLTLGDGDIAPYILDSIYFSKNYRRWRVLDNGPLRTTFELEYDKWNVNGMMVSVSKRISLDAGSQLSRIEATFVSGEKRPLPVVVGLAKRKEQGAMLLDEQQGIMAYWEPQHGEDGITGVGTILITPVTGIRVTAEQILANTISANSEPVVYYTGACWNKANEITSPQTWFEYMHSFKKRLSDSLKIVME